MAIKTILDQSGRVVCRVLGDNGSKIVLDGTTGRVVARVINNMTLDGRTGAFIGHGDQSLILLREKK